MSSTYGELVMRNSKNKATYDRLEKDVAAVKNDIAALTEQITDALNSFAGTAKKQARRGYKQARANVDSAVEEASERGSAAMDAAQDAAYSIEETLEDVIAQRPLATVGLALGLGFLYLRYGLVYVCLIRRGVFIVVGVSAAGCYMPRKQQVEARAAGAAESAKSAVQTALAAPVLLAAGIQVVRAIGVKKLIPILAVGGLVLGFLASRNSSDDETPEA